MMIKKTGLYKVFDFTKEGSDSLGPKMGFYKTNAKCTRWNISTFSFVPDTAPVNASIIFVMNSNKDPTKESTFQCFPLI